MNASKFSKECEDKRLEVEAISPHSETMKSSENSEIVEKTEVSEETVEFEELEKPRLNHSINHAGEGCISIIRHKKCGTRLQLDNTIWRALGCPQFVRLCMANKELWVFPGTPNNVSVKSSRTFEFDEAVRSYKSKIVLYACDAVKSLVKSWNLDTDKYCCFTGGEYKIMDYKGMPAAVITFASNSAHEYIKKSNDDAENVIA